MKKETIILAKSLKWNVQKYTYSRYIVEIPIKNKKVLLKEKSNGWLLICNQKPQIILKMKETLEFMKEMRKRV